MNARKADITAAHDRLELLEHEGRFADAEAFFAANRWAFDYDREGHFVGHVPNENGWAA